MGVLGRLYHKGLFSAMSMLQIPQIPRLTLLFEMALLTQSNFSSNPMTLLVTTRDLRLEWIIVSSWVYHIWWWTSSPGVMNIKPWGNEPDLHAMSDERRLAVARKCFEELRTSICW